GGLRSSRARRGEELTEDQRVGLNEIRSGIHDSAKQQLRVRQWGADSRGPSGGRERPGPWARRGGARPGRRGAAAGGPLGPRAASGAARGGWCAWGGGGGLHLGGAPCGCCATLTGSRARKSCCNSFRSIPAVLAGGK